MADARDRALRRTEKSIQKRAEQAGHDSASAKRIARDSVERVDQRNRDRGFVYRDREK